MDKPWEFKQNFDDSTLWLSNEGDGEVMLEIALVLDNGEISRACIWLSDSQRLDMIGMLTECATNITTVGKQ